MESSWKMKESTIMFFTTDGRFIMRPVDRAGGRGAESWLGQFIHPTMKGNSMQYQASHNLNNN